MPFDDDAKLVQQCTVDQTGSPVLWLFIWPPEEADCTSLHSFLKDRAECFPGPGYRVRTERANLSSLVYALQAQMEASEVEATRTLLLEEERDPGPQDFGSVDRLPSLIARLQGNWVMDLVTKGRLDTDFQPIVYAEEPSRIFAHEGLLRARASASARISAGPILASAGKAGLGVFLDRMARQAHLRHAADRGLESLLFLNLLPSTMMDSGANLKHTVDALAECGLRHDRLVFEVVESEQISDIHALARALDRYRAEGFQVALDDVGAGYSSLNLLPHLRPDYVKIDKELISKVNEDRVRAVIVERLVELADGLGIKVIAEGVETRQEFQWLAAKGVDFIQGFHIAKPAPCPQARIDLRRGA